MMRDDSRSILDDILRDWHKWANGYQHVGGIGTSPMFRDAKTSRGWDSLDAIVDETIGNATMESVNFHVMELAPDHRTCIQLHARNLSAGACVWSSPRLPSCPEALAALLVEAKAKLLKRLVSSGVI